MQQGKNPFATIKGTEAPFTKCRGPGRCHAQVSQNWMPRVTHVVAQDTSSLAFQARKDKRDMLSLDWLLECAAARRLVPPRPHHYLHLTKKSMQSVPNICKYGDMCAASSPPSLLAGLLSLAQCQLASGAVSILGAKQGSCPGSSWHAVQRTMLACPNPGECLMLRCCPLITSEIRSSLRKTLEGWLLQSTLN